MLTIKLCVNIIFSQEINGLMIRGFCQWYFFADIALLCNTFEQDCDTSHVSTGVKMLQVKTINCSFLNVITVSPAGSWVERLFLHQGRAGMFRFCLGWALENKIEVELIGSVFPQVWPLLEDRARLQRPEQQIPAGDVPGGGRAPVPGLCSQILLPGRERSREFPE